MHHWPYALHICRINHWGFGPPWTMTSPSGQSMCRFVKIWAAAVRNRFLVIFGVLLFQRVWEKCWREKKKIPYMICLIWTMPTIIPLHDTMATVDRFPVDDVRRFKKDHAPCRALQRRGARNSHGHARRGTGLQPFWECSGAKRLGFGKWEKQHGEWNAWRLWLFYIIFIAVYCDLVI